MNETTRDVFIVSGIIIAVFVLFFIFSNVNFFSEYQEQLTYLDYRYNFTRCVFDMGDSIVVCNLLMRESCEEITYIDQNCEVLE